MAGVDDRDSSGDRSDDVRLARLLDDMFVKPDKMPDYFVTNTSSQPLAADDIRAAAEKLMNGPSRPPCGSRDRPHAVHPRAHGWTMCGDCMGPVFVP